MTLQIDVSISAGTRVFIGALPATTPVTDDDFRSVTWTEIEEVQSLGNFGDVAKNVDFTALKDARVRSFKGSRDAGMMPIQVGAVALDPGQAALEAAEAVKFAYPFKVEIPDSPDPNSYVNTNVYFMGRVMSNPLDVGAADNVIKETFNVRIVTKPLKVATHSPAVSGEHLPA